MLYGGILVGFGASAVAISLAELASMYVLPPPSPSSAYLYHSDPTVGAQYRWSAHLAPRAPRFWGLLQGALVLPRPAAALGNRTLSLPTYTLLTR